MGHRFDPKHVARLDSPERRKLLPPDQILSNLNIHTHHVVADIGCGPGYFTLPIARMTENSVYAVDVSREMLDVLKEKAEPENFHHLFYIESPAESIQLESGTVDRLLCSFVLHEVDNLADTLKEFKRILKKDGQMLLLEWEKKETEIGPPVQERISSEDLVQAVKEAGFQCQLAHPNQSHYMLIVN